MNTRISKNVRIKIILILIFVSLIMVSGMWVFNNMFVLRNPGNLTYGLKIFIPIVILLITLASVIINSVLAPVVNTLKTIEENGNPGLEERMKARRRIKYIPLIFILVNIGGFFLGPTAMMTVRVVTGLQPFFTLLNILTIFYNMCIGLVSSLEQIVLSDIVLSKPKELLGVFEFSDKKARGKGELSLFAKNIIIPVALVLMIGSMTGIAGWAFYRDAVTSRESTGQQTGTSPGELQTEYIITLGSIFGVLLLAGSGIAVSFSFGQVKQIKRLGVKISELLEGDSTFTQRLSITHFDEIGEVTGRINHFISFINVLLKNTKAASIDVTHSTSSLHESIKQVTGSTQDLERATEKVRETMNSQGEAVHTTGNDIEEIIASIHNVSQNVEKQAVFVEETSAAIIEMTTGINSIKNMVQKARDISAGLEEKANTGDMKVADTIENMKQIEKAAGIVEGIVEVISSIASQTNLLAMNAAIEAAHAGNVGRGFAVVAEEIRMLAEESDESAKHIANQINSMNDQITKGATLTEETGEMLQSIISGIHQNAAIMNEITGAIQEQSAGTEQILKATQAVVNTTHEIKHLIGAQLEKNQYIHERLKNLTRQTDQIDAAVQTQVQTNSILMDILEKMKQVTESNNNVVSQLKNTIGSIEI